LCKSCGRYIYRDKAEQFKYDLEFEMNKIN
jgi:hypothetical protein